MVEGALKSVASTGCLVDSLPDEISAYMAGLDQIQHRPQWACNSHTLHLFDIAFAEISSVKNQNFRDSPVASKMFGDCHVQLRGHDIGELVKTESRVVTVYAFRSFLTILRPQIPEHQIRALCRGKIGQPIDTTMLPDPVSDFHVVGMGLFGESCSRGLLGGEEPPVEIALFRRAVLRLLCMVPPWHNPLTFLGNSASCPGTRQWPIRPC